MTEVRGDLVKVERLRCQLYRTWIRTLPCSVPGCLSTQIDAHHLTCAPEPKARGLKQSDLWCVPLCWHHHRPTSSYSVHHKGAERAWWSTCGIDPVALAGALVVCRRAMTGACGCRICAPDPVS